MAWHIAPQSNPPGIGHSGLVAEAADYPVMVYIANKQGAGEDHAAQLVRLMELLNAVAPDGVIPAAED